MLAGLSAAQIASQLGNPASPVAKAIEGSASVIITAIDQIQRGTRRPTASKGRSFVITGQGLPHSGRH